MIGWNPSSLTLIVQGIPREFGELPYTAETEIIEIHGTSLINRINVEFVWETMRRSWMLIWEELS